MVFGGVGGVVVVGGGGEGFVFLVGSLLFSEHFYVCPFVFSYTDYYVRFALMLVFCLNLEIQMWKKSQKQWTKSKSITVFPFCFILQSRYSMI